MGKIADTFNTKTSVVGALQPAAPTKSTGIAAALSAAPVTPKPSTPPVTQPTSTPQYFAGKNYGFSNLTDTYSGKPLLTFTDVANKKSTLLDNRVATTFDPTVPQKLTMAVLHNDRLPVSASSKVKTSLGGNYDDNLDHLISLELSGSNENSNLKNEKLVNGKQSSVPLENQLAQEVINGDKTGMTLEEAQKILARAKGIKLPNDTEYTSHDHPLASLYPQAKQPAKPGVLDTIVKGAETVGSKIVGGVKSIAQILSPETPVSTPLTPPQGPVIPGVSSLRAIDQAQKAKAPLKTTGQTYIGAPDKNSVPVPYSVVDYKTGGSKIKVPFTDKYISAPLDANRPLNEDPMASSGMDRFLNDTVKFFIQFPEEAVNSAKDIYNIAFTKQHLIQRSDTKAQVPTFMDAAVNTYDSAIANGNSESLAKVAAVTGGVSQFLLDMGVITDALSPVAKYAVQQLPRSFLEKILTTDIPAVELRAALTGAEGSSPVAEKFVKSLTTDERKSLFGVIREAEKTGGAVTTIQGTEPTALGEFAGIKPSETPGFARTTQDQQLPGYLAPDPRAGAIGDVPREPVGFGPTEKTPKGLEPLAEEARKYKSAEEFVKAKTDLFHGSIGGDFKSFDPSKFSTGTGSDYFGKGAYLTDNLEAAKDYAYKDYSKVIPFSKGNANIFDAEKGLTLKELSGVLDKLPTGTTIDKTGWLDIAKMERPTLHSLKKALTRPQVEELVSAIKEAGYDGISFNARPDGIGGRYVTVFNPEKLMNESQLTDFYNQATKGTVSPKAEPVVSKPVPKGTPNGTSSEPVKTPKIAENKQGFNELISYGERNRPTKLGFVRRAKRWFDTSNPDVVTQIEKAYDDLIGPPPTIVTSGAKAPSSSDLAKKGIPTFRALAEDFKLPETKQNMVDEAIRNAISKDSYDQAKMRATNGSFFQGKEKETFFQKLKRTLRPLQYQDKAVQVIFRRYFRTQLLNKEVANEALKTLSVPNKEGLQTILDYQAGKQTPYSLEIKDIFQSLFREANARGLSLGWKDNYLPQVYKESPADIKKAMAKYLDEKGVDEEAIANYLEGIQDLPDEVVRRLGLNPSFTKLRTFPDYATAMRYGLHPKYTNPAQLVSYYREQMENTINNRELVKELVDKNKIVEAIDAPGFWKPIELPFSKKGYYAPPKLAEMLNGIFTDPSSAGILDKISGGFAKVSRVTQEISLSGGAPRTNFNFFSMGQLIKALTAGDVKAIPAFFRSNSNKASLKYFQDNSDILKMMAGQGLDLGGRLGQYGKVFKNLADNKKWLEQLGDQWNKAFNEKTFASLMPQLYVENYKEVYKRSLKKGMSEAEAQHFAGEVTKKFFGLMENVGRSRSTENVVSSLFFAPKFREGIVNVLLETLKGATTEFKNPVYYKNRRLLIGMVLTFGAYQALNKAFNGSFTWNNEPGHEFDLKLTLPDGDYIYIPFMPSFLAFARALVSIPINLARGEFPVATQKAGSLLSQPLQVLSQVWTNRDYYDQKIYQDTDTGPTKIKKITEYVGKQFLQPWIKETINYFESKEPLYQGLSKALEFPFKYSTPEQALSSRFYAALDDVAKKQARKKEEVQAKYDEAQKLVDQGKTQEAQDLVNGLSDEDYKIYKAIKTAAKSKETKKAEIQMYDTVNEVQDLVNAGKNDEAQAILDGLSDSDYKNYRLAKKKLGF